MKGTVLDHRTTILELLDERGSMSRADLAALTGLSPATLSRAISELRRAGLVREATEPATGPGRPAGRVRLRPDGAHVVGIDAGGSMLRGVLADLDGTIRRHVSRAAADPADGARLLDQLVALVSEATEPGDGSPTLAVVAGVSGIVDPATGTVRMSPDLPGLTGMDVAGRLEVALGIPVRIDNDDILAAVGEAAAGAARGASDVVFLSLGFGLGAGILVDGRPLRGAANAAGAIGFVGSRRLDEIASGRAIPARYAAALAAGGGRATRDAPSAGTLGAMSGGTDLDARLVLERAAAGDPVARRVVAEAVEAIAEMATDVAAVVDPEIVVLGGGLVEGSPSVVDEVGRRLRATLPFPPRVALSALAGTAVVHGAVTLALAHARTHLPAGPGRRSSRPAARPRTVLQLV